MTVLLLATTLGLQAQSYTSPSSSSSSSSSQQTEEQRRKDQQQAQSAYGQSSTSTLPEAETTRQRQEREEREKKEKKDQNSGSRYSINESAPNSQSSSSTELKYRSNQPAEVQKNSQQASTNSSQTSSSAQTGAQTQTGVQSSSQTEVAVTGQVETEVRTVVQQIDAQGPVIVERISTEFADATCTQENARALVEALHNGTSVTLRNEDGQTATFTPTVRLGYGDAYVAMAVAVQALREAGITGCASPAQWQAVLLGGELSGPTVRTTSVTTARFPGILVLHSQGGWTKVAQTTHVQLNQVVSQANSSLQISGSNANSTAQASSANVSTQQNLSPVGRPRDYDPRASDKSKDESAKAKEHDKDKKNHDSDQKKGDVNSPDTENPPKSETPPKY